LKINVKKGGGGGRKRTHYNPYRGELKGKMGGKKTCAVKRPKLAGSRPGGRILMCEPKPIEKGHDSTIELVLKS